MPSFFFDAHVVHLTAARKAFVAPPLIGACRPRFDGDIIARSAQSAPTSPAAMLFDAMRDYFIIPQKYRAGRYYSDAFMRVASNILLTPTRCRLSPAPARPRDARVRHAVSPRRVRARCARERRDACRRLPLDAHACAR
jgi:hypothetical protein